MILAAVLFSPPRLVVGAPQEVKAANQTGGLYWCDYGKGRCEAIPLQGEWLPVAGTQVQAPMRCGSVGNTVDSLLGFSSVCRP